ncbi:MAG: NmrA family NAD(P)-binding protein [Corynebacteriales bacterium]|nr:NmrA family NAD(P)-binding protein [Mycobacteriales bacterium]
MRPTLWRKNTRNRLVICGTGNLALRLVEELHRIDEAVTVVVRDPAEPLAIRMADRGARIVVGPSSDPETLRAAGVQQATSLALLDPDDVDVIHAALAAQEINPHIRLVMRVYHPRLGQRVHELFDECTVLSPGDIAAPSFMDAILGGEETQLVKIAGRLLQVGPPGSMGDTVMTLAADGPDGVTLLPHSPTDATLMLGTPDHVRRPSPKLRRHRIRRRLPVTLHVIAGSLISVRTRIALGFLAVLSAIATVVFHAGLGGGWIDAFYRTMTVVTSTGYDDLLEAHAPAWLKLFGAFSMLVGVLVMAVITAIVVDDLIDVRAAERWGAPLGQPRDHVIVCGLGSIGLQTIERLLSEGIPVVAIERKMDAAKFAAAHRLNIPVIEGDASEADVLRKAGLCEARCLAVLTSDDVTNLQTGLVSKQITDTVRVVLRLYDSDLADRVGRRLGLTISRSVSMASAPVFAAAMLGRGVLAVVPYRRQVLLFAEVPVAEHCAINGAPLSLMDSNAEARVIAMVRNGETTWSPNGDVRVQGGDHIFVAATRAGMGRALRLTGATSSSEAID